MAKQFTDKQQKLLEALVPDVKAGRMGTDWLVSEYDGGLHFMNKNSHPDVNLHKLGWDNIPRSYLTTFIKAGIFSCESDDLYTLNEVSLLNAYERNFEMPESPTPGPTLNFPYATFTGITNINTTLNNSTQYIQNAPGLDKDFKQQFDVLIRELRDALAPLEGEKDANAVAKHAERLAQDVAEDDKEEIESSLEKLTKAAKNLAAVTPIVIPIATRIAELIATLPK